MRVPCTHRPWEAEVATAGVLPMDMEGPTAAAADGHVLLERLRGSARASATQRGDGRRSAGDNREGGTGLPSL
jgi:hypothetical protein